MYRKILKHYNICLCGQSCLDSDYLKHLKIPFDTQQQAARMLLHALFSFSFFFTLIIYFESFRLVVSTTRKDPDVGKSMYDLVVSKGYYIERHWTTTEDGYILGMFRMPLGKGETFASTKPVVYLNHALLDSSFAFICNAPNESLGYILADRGYDVWFGNNRGNTYSANHTTLSTESAAFWNFTYDEMALYDLPAHINYVLDHTGASSLSYIGHSQGTIQAFAGFPSFPNLAKKINLFVGMAPVAYVHHQRGWALNVIADLDVDRIFQFLGVKKFLTKDFISKFAPWLCDVLPNICDDVIELIVGPANNINASRIDVYVGQTPAGTSVKNMVHWGQGLRAEGFQMYDEGSAKANLRRYNSTTPPAYNLSKFNVPTILYTGGKDYLADPKDVQTLISSLPEGVLKKYVNLPSYAHLDFTWAPNAYFDVYESLLEYLPQKP